MEVVRVNERMMKINGTICIEAGPARVTAVATEALLANEVTAEHYQVGRFDALSRPIVLGEEMTYLDWLGDYVHYLYLWDGEFWQHHSVYDTAAEAFEAAKEMVLD